MSSDPIDMLFDEVRRTGVAVSTVRDGHILVFDREHLQKIIDKHPDKETFVIFVKRGDIQ